MDPAWISRGSRVDLAWISHGPRRLRWGIHALGSLRDARRFGSRSAHHPHSDLCGMRAGCEGWRGGLHSEHLPTAHLPRNQANDVWRKLERGGAVNGTQLWSGAEL
jgi:hypothetical protein